MCDWVFLNMILKWLRPQSDSKGEVCPLSLKRNYFYTMFAWDFNPYVSSNCLTSCYKKHTKKRENASNLVRFPLWFSQQQVELLAALHRPLTGIDCSPFVCLPWIISSVDIILASTEGKVPYADYLKNFPKQVTVVYRQRSLS